MKLNIATPWRKGANGQAPGEPLYTQAELAVKLNMTQSELHGLMARNPGLVHWPRSASHKDRTPYLYRLSDGRKWLTSVKEK